MARETELAIIIVTWNNHDLIETCLQSAQDELDRSGIVGELWVVDNASNDGTADVVVRFSDVRLLRAGANLGFAAGNNLGLRAIGFPDGEALPEYVLLLNPDTIVRSGAFAELLSAADAVDAGLAGASLFYEDGSFQHGAFRFPGLWQLMIDLFPMPARLYESALNGRYRRELYSKGEPFEIDFPLGAVFLLRRDVIQKTGLFDEAFWLYCEEIDWAMRIKAAGYRAVCVPRAEVVHLAGKSTEQVRSKAFVNLWKARLQLFRKHYPPLKRFIAMLIIRIGMKRKRHLFTADQAIGPDTRAELLAACDTITAVTRER